MEDDALWANSSHRFKDMSDNESCKHKIKHRHIHAITHSHTHYTILLYIHAKKDDVKTCASPGVISEPVPPDLSQGWTWNVSFPRCIWQKKGTELQYSIWIKYFINIIIHPWWFWSEFPWEYRYRDAFFILVSCFSVYEWILCGRFLSETLQCQLTYFWEAWTPVCEMIVHPCSRRKAAMSIKWPLMSTYFTIHTNCIYLA